MAEVIVERVRARDWHGAAGRIPANDNVRGSVLPDDDRPFFLALGLICAGVLILAAYVVMGGPDDLMTVALRR